MKTFQLISIVLMGMSLVCGTPDPEITISDGTLRGLILSNYNGEEFYAFTGIPFAKPPIGSHRFKAPVQNEAWNGVLDATNDSPICTQPNQMQTAPIGQEDCLYLNVFTKSLNCGALKPVMVYIHGGKFTEGGGSMYGPGYLMNEDIVLVTINYRLGIYGFINLVDGHHDYEELVANNGLRDQIMALKWVQRNIPQFGGNPNMVTLSGESAGAMSTHAHILSPLSKGLFHRAILMSGTTLMVMVPTLNNTALTVAKLLGIDSGDHNLMVNQLKNTSSDELFKAQKKMNWFSIQLNKPTATALVIEKPGPNSFIADYPLNIIKSGNYNKVPTLLGATSREGLLLVRDPRASRDLNQHVPFYFKNRKEAAQVITKHYNMNETSDLNNITMYSDIWFRYNTFRTAIEHIRSADDTDLYYYEFSGDAALNFLKFLSPAIQHYAGACHADDLGYLFSNDLLPTCSPNSPEERLMKLMVELWTSFVKYGKPAKNWPKFQHSAYNFANITNDGLQFGVLHDKNFEFWNDMYETYSNGLF